MTMTEWFLWIYDIMCGLLLGGALFERLVLVSVWASAPPDSVRQWNNHPEYKLDPSGRFFKFVTLPLMLLTPINAWLAWRMGGSVGQWLLISTACVLVVIIATIAYFAPLIIILTYKNGAGLDDEAVRKKTAQWLGWQYLRLAVLAAGWIAGLKALQILG